MYKETANQLSSDLIQARDQMVNLINTTPDDKLNWSPSPTARTPIELVGHTAGAFGPFIGMLQNEAGSPGGFDPTSFDSHLREIDKEFKSKEQVLKLFHDGCDKYLNYIDSLDEAALAKEIIFFTGPMPRIKLLPIGVNHTLSHAGQLAYLQTIWGDRDWHLKL